MYLFTFIDYVDVPVFLLYLYTVVLGFVMTLSVYCKPNKMVMMLLLHCWYILTCRFNAKTAGLMPSMARMSGGPFEEKMDTLKNK